MIRSLRPKIYRKFGSKEPLKKLRKLEPGREERTTIGVNEDGIEVFDDVDWNEQRAAATGMGVMGVLPCYEDILETKRCLSARHRCLISSRQLQGLTHHHLDCYTFQKMIQMTCLQFRRKCRLLALSLVLSYFVILVNISKVLLFFSFLINTDYLHRSQYMTGRFAGKSDCTYVASDNITGL